eukprot:12917689-Prorocentrum_lima.AAC.1
MYQKTVRQLITYKELATTPEHPHIRQHYEAIDYCLAPRRWRNAILDAEAHFGANIMTPYNPG